MPGSNRININNRSKRWIIVLASVVVLLIILIYGVERYLESYLEVQLPKTFEKVSNGRFQVSFKNLDLNLWQQDLTIDEPDITPVPGKEDSTHIIRAQLQNIRFEGFGILSYYLLNSYQVDNISVEQPMITLKGRIQENISDEINSLSNLTNNIRNYTIRIGSFNYLDGKLIIKHTTDGTHIDSAQHINLHFQNLVADSAKSSKFPFFRFDDIQLNAENIHLNTPGGYYHIDIDAVELSSKDQRISLDSLSITPQYPRYEFSRTFGYETDRLAGEIPSIRFDRININDLIENRLASELLEIREIDIEVFHDKHQPRPPNIYRKLPRELLHSLPFTVNIDTIRVLNSKVTYSEHLPKTEIAGHVTFNNLSASIYNLSNDSTVTQSEKEPVYLDVKTSVMNSAMLNMHAQLDMDESQKQQLNGSLDRLSIEKLNPVLKPLGFIQVTSGDIESMEFSMELTPDTASGEVLMAYDGLKIKILDRDKIQEGGDKDLASVIANTFKIKSSNQNLPLRRGTISFERNTQKSFLNYWWKSLLTGLKDTIGL